MRTTTLATLTIGCALAGLLTTPPSQAQEESVYSVNIVGFQQVELPGDGQSRMVAMPFNEEGMTLLDVFGTNTLRQNNTLGLCDRVTIYDPLTQTYQRWAQWIDGKFYRANDAAEWAQGIEGNPTIAKGTGFWLQSAATPGDHQIVLSGDVVQAGEQTIHLVDGFQITAYPFSSDLDLTGSTSFLLSGASANNTLGLADRITLYDHLAATYQRYALWTDGNWYKANDGAEWAQGIPADIVIEPGTAFWYQAVNSYEWTEVNPYSELFE